jgi:hypothetical protein
MMSGITGSGASRKLTLTMPKPVMLVVTEHVIIAVSALAFEVVAKA